MRKYLAGLMEDEKVRYIFFGGLTTGVNLSVYSFLRYAGNVSVNTANLISIAAAVIFAFFVNRFFVFRIETADGKEIVWEFVNFTVMRTGTLAAEFFGIWFLNSFSGIPDFINKCLFQVIVIVLNYVISKFVVFRPDRIGGAANE